MIENKDFTIVDDETKEQFVLSDEQVEVVKMVFDELDGEIKDLEGAIATQRSKNYLFGKLLKDYPNNNGVCYVNKREVANEVAANTLEYDDDDLISAILDRLENELEFQEEEYQKLLDQLDDYDLLSIFFELEGEAYKVVAMDRNIVKENGIDWALDKFKAQYGDELSLEFYTLLKRFILDWLDNE